MKNRSDADNREQNSSQVKMRVKNILENIFVIVLAFYPLRHIAWGLDLWDTGYNYANFQYMGTEHMDSMWLFSTYLANAVGSLLMKLPSAGSLMGMNLYTGLFVSILALTGFLFCYRVLKMPLWIAFIGELAAVSLCWCPTALLYNYLTYVLLTVCVILLYQGLTREKKWCLFGAGICLGANVLVRFSNLPEAALILAVWAYDFILWREIKKTEQEEGEKPRFWPRLLKHTLWCLLGYLAALAVLFGYIHLRYGMGAYVEGIKRLFAMTDRATDYKAASMLMGMIRVYTENFYWVKRIGVLIAGGMVLLFGVGKSKARFDHSLRNFGTGSARFAKVLMRVIMGLLSVVMAWWIYRQDLLSLLLQDGDELFPRLVALILVLGAVLSLVYCVGDIVFSGLLGIVMLGWLYFREFCSPAYYSYDSILRPGILFLMLAMLIAVIRIFYPKCPKEEKLISGLVLLTVLITSIGSNNGVYPSMNNLFIAAPYVLWYSWRFLRHMGEVRIRKMQMSSLPAKGMLAAFLAMCLFQFGMFGYHFVFAEATGVQNPDSYVENNPVLKGIRMSEEKARWMSEISGYVNDNGLQGQEVILYGWIPSLSYYLQMPSAFNPWSDLDSYSIEQMELALKETADEMELKGERPVIIVAQSTKNKPGNEKWLLLVDFMEQNGYKPDFSNGQFTVYR